MDLRGIPKSTRWFCCFVLLVVGYSPFLIDFFVISGKYSFDPLSNSYLSSKRGVLFQEFPKESGLVCDLLWGNLLHDRYNQSEKVTPEKITKKLQSEYLLAGYIATIPSGKLAGSKFASGSIKSNFYLDARALGVPPGVLDCVTCNMASKVDFRRSLQKGDKFEIIYDKVGTLLYCGISTKRRNIAIYKFSQGTSYAYYFDNGVKVETKANSNFFAQPLNGKLRVVSGFGNRVHPILGKSKMHSGVDLKATYGSPVYSIFDGVVTRASSYCGYGNCVDVKHTLGYSSRYAHLSRYAVSPGMKIKKGQLVGYVGATGLAEGAHLHLELAHNNRLLNPLCIRMIPKTAPVIPANFDSLKRQMKRISSAFKNERWKSRSV
ncbi:MAG: M23 family metallopeptidase [Holosporaceae bacterium]|nr:M23 family metallopeptidase [Holosporaceae bacterium]